MRVQSISINPIINTYKKAVKSDYKQLQNDCFIPSNSVSFGSKKYYKRQNQINLYNAKVEELQELGVCEKSAKKFAHLGISKYNRVCELAKKGVFDNVISQLIHLKTEQYQKALALAQIGIYDEKLIHIINSKKNLYGKALKLNEEGIGKDYISDYITLGDGQIRRAKKLIEKGYSPDVAMAFLEIPIFKRHKFEQLMQEYDIDIETALTVIALNKKEKSDFKKFLDMGLSVYNASDLCLLDEEQQEKAVQLIKMGICHSTILDFVVLDDIDFEKAINMYKEGVHESYIPHIIDIENNKKTNNQYKNFLKQGCSRTSAYALSLLDDDELQAFYELSKINPQINELLKDNYDIEIIPLQVKGTTAAVIGKQFYTEDKQTVYIVKIFDNTGILSDNRTQEDIDNSSTSYQRNGNDIYRIKYNKFDGIAEMTHLILDDKTKGIKGVIHTTSSKVIEGLYDSKYYDISDFKEDTSPDGINCDFDNSLKPNAQGTVISKAVKNPDGSISYNERFYRYKNLIERHYNVLNDENSNIIKSDYSYEITNEKGEKILNIKRSYEKTSADTIKNTINGIEYTVKYDDKNHIITISDGESTKEFPVSNIIKGYAQEVLWKTLKTLQADTLIALLNNIEKWNYCSNFDSSADGNELILTSGLNSGIINHEIGHFLSYNKKATEDEDLKQIYLKEMNAFEKIMPYNEQAFIHYFSPYAYYHEDAEGLSEFIAETNSLLCSVGINEEKFKTRNQMLVRYFPETIAKVAQLLGYHDNKSLLEEK